MSTSDTIVTDRLLLIVVGAHLRAEQSDRPLAYRLRERILRWIDGATGADTAENKAKTTADTPPPIPPPPPALLEPLVCTDLWYLNNEELIRRPTITIGAPGVNACTAFLTQRLPSVFVIDDTLQVLMDPELTTLHACCWGVDQSATVSAVDLFAERFLDRFLNVSLGRDPDAPSPE